MVNKGLHQSHSYRSILKTSYKPLYTSIQQLQCIDLIEDYLTNKQKQQHVRGLLKDLEQTKLLAQKNTLRALKFCK